jgi:hypothetical protein
MLARGQVQKLPTAHTDHLKWPHTLHLEQTDLHLHECDHPPTTMLRPLRIDTPCRPNDLSLKDAPPASTHHTLSTLLELSTRHHDRRTIRFLCERTLAPRRITTWIAVDCTRRTPTTDLATKMHSQRSLCLVITTTSKARHANAATCPSNQPRL